MHLACRYGHHSLVSDLMSQYGLDPNEPKNVSPSIYSYGVLRQATSWKYIAICSAAVGMCKLKACCCLCKCRMDGIPCSWLC